MTEFNYTYNFRLEGLDLAKFQKDVASFLSNTPYSLGLDEDRGFGMITVKSVTRQDASNIHLWFTRTVPKSGVVHFQKVSA